MLAPGSLPNQSVVRKALAPHTQWITRAILGAWQDWRGFPHGPSWRCNRSRANFVWEQIIGRALSAVVGAPNVQYKKANETFTFIVNGVVVFRFKKANEEGISANIPTQTALAFHDHQITVPGIPPVHRVEVVYQLNALETNIQDILVVARNGDRVHWYCSLLPASTVAMPPAAATPTPTPPARVVPREKQADEKQSRDS